MALIKGDVPATGRLVIDNDSSVDCWWVAFGVESNALYDTSASSAWLFSQAESLTAMGGSATAAGPSGASGSGSNVMRNTALTTPWLAMLSTQATGGGAHLTHVGEFRVYARVQTSTSNSGTVSLAWEWAFGDFLSAVRNSSVDLDPAWEGSWRLVDLGLVNIPKVLSGTQRWEGRLLAKSTVAGDDLDIDCLWLVPAVGGVAKGVLQRFAPTAYLGFDDFGQTAGALAGKTAPTGGTWAGAGDADDFNVSGTGNVTRTAVSDTANTGRYAILGSSAPAGVEIGVDCASSAESAQRTGILARYTDTSNWLQAYVTSDAGIENTVTVRKRVAGTITTLASVTPPSWVGPEILASRLRLTVDASGRYALYHHLLGSPDNPLNEETLLLRGQDSALATGGALATGKFGIYDENSSAVAATRTFENFYAAAYSTDAAIYAGQSLEWRSDGVIRENSSGAIWQPVSSFEGDLLRVPPAGLEGRTARFIVIPSKHDPDVMPHDFGAISARLTYTPRFLTVPAS